MTLQHILAPLPTSTFMSHYLGREFIFVNGHENKFAELLPWEALNAVLCDASFIPGQLRLVKAGTDITFSSYAYPKAYKSYTIYRLLSNEINNALRDGATLIINGIQHLYEPIRAVA